MARPSDKHRELVPAEVYNRLNEVMTNFGINERQLTEELGLPRSTYQNWKNFLPGSKALWLTANYLGVTMEYLLSGQEDRTDINYKQKKLVDTFDDLPLDQQQAILTIVASMHKSVETAEKTEKAE